jgi:hypothetical protein
VPSAYNLGMSLLIGVGNAFVEPHCGCKVSDVRSDTRTEGLAQLMEDSQAEVTARVDARLEAVQHTVYIKTGP